MRRAVDLDPGTTRPAPAKGVPARLPGPQPAFRKPPTRPGPGPSGSDLVIDLRALPEGVEALVGARCSPELTAGGAGSGAGPGRGSSSASLGSRGSSGSRHSDPERVGTVIEDTAPPDSSLGAREPRPAQGQAGAVRSTDSSRGTLVPTQAAGDSGATASVPDPNLTTAWPEIRFYLGSFGLFFVAYAFITALLVGLAVMLLGLHPVAITSGSMEPLIQVGDVVLFADPPAVERESPDEGVLLPGTVIGFDERGTDRAVTHRIVSIERGGSYVTRGDSNPSPDPQVVSPEQVWGVGQLLVPYGGYPAAWLAVGAHWKVLMLSVFLLGCAYSSRWALLDEFNPWLDR